MLEHDQGLAGLILHDQGLDDAMLVDAQFAGGMGRATAIEVVIGVADKGDARGAQGADGLGHGFFLLGRQGNLPRASPRRVTGRLGQGYEHRPGQPGLGVMG